MPPRGRRPAGGSDTREAILGAASELFARVGFERTTMREVASRAEVDPALIHHYFTNKDGLLAAALALPMDPAALLAGLDQDPDHAGREIVRRVLGMWESDQETRRRLLALMRVGLAHEHAAGVLRDLLGRTILAAVARVVAEDERPLRAALVGSQMGGLMLGRYLVGIPAVRDATPQQLVAAIGPVIQYYLTGPIGDRAGPAGAPSGPGARRRAGGRNPPVPTGRESAPSPKG